MGEGGGGSVGWILPTGERVGFMVTSHGGAGFWLLPKRRTKKEKLCIYIYSYFLKEERGKRNYIYIYIYSFSFFVLLLGSNQKPAYIYVVSLSSF